MKTLTILTAVLIFLISPRDTTSQDGINVLNKRVVSMQETEITNQMQLAKQTGDVNRISVLQRELDNFTGLSVTKPGEYYPASVHPVNQPDPPFVSDNINIVQISSLSGIRALATTTQQTGIAGSGGILWTVAAVSNSSSNDTIYYFRSTNDGVSWQLFGFVSLGNSDEVNFDEMDIELVEDTGEKYLWCVLGLTGGNGKKFIGGIVSKTSVFTAGAFAFAWPGENFSNTNYGTFRPRITSDNAAYFSTASVYIIAAQDTLPGGNSAHVGNIKAVKCNNPFTTAPVLTYRTNYLVSVINSHNSDPTDLHADIAYINRNNSDSVSVVVSHFDGIITLVKTYISFTTWNTALSGGGYSLTTDGGASNNKEFARIASNGGPSQRDIMIIYREDYQNSGDWDVKSLYSSNAGMNFVTQNIDVRRSTTNIPLVPEITGRRNSAGKFFAAYTYSTASFDTVKYCATYPSGGVNWGSLLTMSHQSAFQRPKPGFRFVDSDTCFVVWAERQNSVNFKIWASNGCSGAISIGIQNISSEIPAKFSLGQNYPNPFNPVTNIEFHIAHAEFVSMKIYDILGREAAVVVNESLSPGIYKADFDASALASGIYFYTIKAGSYSETKKMLLVK